MSLELALILALVASMVLTAVLIPVLRRAKFGQQIREIGPSWHKNKSGTPTMGGIGFIIAVTAIGVFANLGNKMGLIVVLGALAFGIIGFIDDYIKVVLKRNLGLRAWQKFAMQLAVAIGVMMALSVWLETSIPLFGWEIELGMAYIPLMVFVILGCVNAVNLTDGLDGLAGSVTAIVGTFFMVAFHGVNNMGLSLASAALVGGLLGFLIFNFHPAKVFMGDTGSLFLGGIVALLAIGLGNPLILILVGVIYVIETLSVIMQVFWFKLTKGKRLFKMSPLHHHFEQVGWGEKKIVGVFCLITLVACVVALGIV